MSVEDLESEIKKFVEISENLPERYRDRCFEILLSNMLKPQNPSNPIPVEPIEQEESPDFQMPVEVRALLRQFNIDESKIFELFLITGSEEIAPIYKLQSTVVAKSQIEIALLTALENTLTQKGKFEFSIEDVRTRCKDHNRYNHKNFMTNISNNAKFFKSIEDDEHVVLSPYGKEKLIEIINAF